MQERFYSIVKAIIDPTKKILLAVSGGLDSVALLDVASKSKLTIEIAHVNFQLRGIESDEDENFVKTLANLYNVPYFSIQFNTNTYAEEHGLSIQMAARQLRYDWFEKIMEKGNFDFLFTAHHLNDNLETSLLNFTRGTGISGMRAMEFQHEKIVRPLLTFTRAELEAYVKLHQLKWREDSSNITSDYHRNFIRHQVIPILKEINPSLENTFANNATRFLGEEELINFAVDQIKHKYIFEEGDGLTIKKEMLQLFKYKSGVLYKLIKEFGFNLDQCEDVIASLNGQSGKQFQASQFTLTNDREFLLITKNSSEIISVKITELDEFIVTKNVELSISSTSTWKLSNNSNIAMLDKCLLQFPIILRSWKPGDYFYPLGMTHKKKVSDFLIDLKISMADKNQVLVLESAGNIVWVVGHRINDRFKITPKTETAITFKITS